MNLSATDSITNDTSAADTFSCPWTAQFRWNFQDEIESWKANGFFDDTYLQYINCHWLQFGPAPIVNHLVLGTLFIFILVIGGFGNIVVLFVIGSSKHLRTPANLLVMNLAVSDLFMLLKLPVFIYNSLYRGPVLGKIGCDIYGFVSGITGTASIMSLAAIALDRYNVINCPLKMGKASRSQSLIAIGLIWLYSTVFASMPFFGLGKYVPEGYLTSCSFDYLSDDLGTRIFILVFFIAAWITPFLIIVSCYLAIFRYAVKVQKELNLGNPQDNQRLSCRHSSTLASTSSGLQNRIDSKTEKTIAKVVLNLIGLWLVSWTPYATIALFGISKNLQPLSPGMAMFPALFAKLSACINPYLYALRHPKVQKELVSRWCQSCLANSPSTFELSNAARAENINVSEAKQVRCLPAAAAAGSPAVDKY